MNGNGDVAATIGRDRRWPQRNGEGKTRNAERGTGNADFGRTLPHSVEAEQGVLGSMLISPREIIAECVEKLKDGAAFYVPAHGTIYTVLVELWNAAQGIDLITFTQVLRDKNLLETVGGASAVTALFTFVPTAANVTYYLEIVQEKYILRQIIAASTESARRAFEEQGEVNLLLDDVQAKMTAIALDGTYDAPVKHAFEAIEGALDEIENAHKQRGRTTGLSTGFVDLDRTTLGLNDGEMVVLGARPSMGKTSLAMQIAQNVALDHREAGRDIKGQPVLIFSIETGAKRLMFRALCAKTKSNIQDLRRGFGSEPKMEEIRKAAQELAGAPIYIDESPSLKVFELKARARYAKAKFDIKLIVIDYLQLVKSPSRRAEFSKTLEITEVSIAIKEIGRELNIPVLAIAQLNREVENRAKARPRMTDLRESGQLEQDADLIMFLHREDYYLPEGSEERAAAEGTATLIVAKQKDGPTAEIRLRFEKEYARFDNLTQQMYSGNPKKRQGGAQARMED